MQTACPHSCGSLSFSALLRSRATLHQFFKTIVFTFVLTITILGVGALTGHAQTFTDSGFVAETVATLPPYDAVGLTFAPDGRIFIWQKTGVVRIIKNGTLLPTPFLDLHTRVNSFGDRGLLGLALDPNFSSNRFVYLLYTFESGPDQNNSAARTARLTRVTASSANPDIAQSNSEVVILGSLGARACSTYPAGADCIPSDGDSHTIGTLRFAPDGKLFVSIGDGAGYASTDALAMRAQDLNSYSGKLIRINKDGTAPGDNPFDDGTNSIRSKIYSYGLRNPYRFTLNPVTGEAFLGDVGWRSWEEVNHGRGANFGWPCYEGYGPQPEYQEQFAQCQQLPSSAVTPPLYTYGHDEGNTIIGGAFYNATQYPSQYRGNFFFADYSEEFIRRMTFDANGNMLGVQTFATDVVSPVSLELGPDGSLYFISLSSGAVQRIKFSGPVAHASANPLSGYSPLNVAFSSSGSLDPGGGALTYLWDFGDGSISTLPNPSHIYTDATVRTFDAKLTVIDSQTRSAVDHVKITIGSVPPTAIILSPANGTPIIPSDVVTFQGTATDPDETLLPGALTWQVLLHHDDHVHPVMTTAGIGGSFTVEYHGEGTYSYEIILTATDSSGLTNTRSITLPVSTSQLPAPWLNQDIGSVGVSGAASHSGGTFAIDGSGADIWDQVDGFHFVYQPLNGDGDIVVRAASLEATHPNAKVGVMIREELTSNSRHAILNVTPGAGIEFMRRLSPGAITTYTSGGNEIAPKWLKLARSGNTFSAFKSNDGVAWTLIGTDTINMMAQVYIGMIVTSHNNSVLCHASVDNVSVHMFGGNAPPVASITSPVNGATFTDPANITINANASDSDGSITRVDFFNGPTLIGTDSSAPYSFTWSNIPVGSYSLTAKATDNLGATTVSAPVNVLVTSPGSAVFADDFNDNLLDQSKWTFGTIQGAIYSGPAAWDPTVSVLERNQRLEISPRSNVSGDHYNGYVSTAAWNLTNARAGIEVVQVASGGSTNTQLALCIDNRNFLMISSESGLLRFEQVINGGRSTTSITYNAVQHRFWRIRHDVVTDSMIFETGVDGQNWTIRRTVARQLSITALKVEASAGTWQGIGAPGTAIFDNFSLDSNSGGPINNPPSVNISSPTNGAIYAAPANIVVDASANDSDGSINRVDFYSGTTLIGSDSQAPYSFSWNNVTAGNYVLTAKATDNAGATTTSTQVNITVNAATTLPSPWLRSDIGSVGLAGDATFATGVFSVRGSGADIWDNSDAFQFVYQPLNGNGQIVARVTGIQFTSDWAKAGVMIRDTLTPGSRHAFAVLSAGNGVAFQRRTTSGGLSDHNSGTNATAPSWVRLVRSGNIFTAYSSTNGVSWVQVGPPVSISMATNVFVGLAVTSHNNATSSLGTFDNVSVTTGTRSSLKFGMRR